MTEAQIQIEKLTERMLEVCDGEQYAVIAVAALSIATGCAETADDSVLRAEIVDVLRVLATRIEHFGEAVQ